MPFQIPTLNALAERTRQAFRANLKGSDAWLWPNNIFVSAKVMAGAVWEAFQFIDYIGRQSIKHLADGPWLERHAHDYGLARLPATFAEGSVTLTGDPSIALPAGLVLRRVDGVEYVTTSAGITSGLGSVTVPVRALVAGKAGNAASGVAVSLTVPVSQMNSDGVVASSGIGLGADAESDEGLRARLLFRLRNPPHGGAAHDYVAWAREINGVTRVFVDPVTETNSRTTVAVWFLMDDLYANGIPQGADVARLKAYIETVRPAGAIVQVAAPTPVSVNVSVAIAPDTVAVRDQVRTELEDFFRRSAAVSTVTDPFTLYKSKLDEAIAIAAGEDHHTLSAPSGNVTYTAGQIPVLGTLTFT